MFIFNVLHYNPGRQTIYFFLWTNPCMYPEDGYQFDTGPI